MMKEEKVPGFQLHVGKVEKCLYDKWKNLLSRGKEGEASEPKSMRIVSSMTGLPRRALEAVVEGWLCLPLKALFM